MANKKEPNYTSSQFESTKDKKASLDKPEVIEFKTQKDWEKWLGQNYERQEGIFIRMFKKASKIESIDWHQALEVALCYGWIDGIRKSYDEVSFIQKYTPRRPRSTWSKVNTEHVARLIKEGRMKPQGLIEVEKAKKDGRWDRAYDSQKNTQVPEDFLKELDKHPKAKEFFSTLNKSNKFAVMFQLQTAKKEDTRLKRIKKFIDMLNRSEKLY